jgi:signal transduction histidine kinase
MAQARTAAGPTGSVMHTAVARLRAATRNVRFIVVVSLVLIAGSFAAASAIQMRLDREHALAQAASFDAQRAQEIAGELSSTLDRYAALGAAFANAQGAESAAALSEAGGAALRNIVVLDASGQVLSEMRGMPLGLLPLDPGTLARALESRIIAPTSDAHTLTILFPQSGKIVAVQLDGTALLPAAGDALLATPQGDIRAAGAQWSELPAASALATGPQNDVTRLIELRAGNRLVSLKRVAGWPLVAGASVGVGEALGAWYGTLPLYLFIILGPSLAGAGLAVIFVREFERRARTAQAMRTLRATDPAGARLLVRLADAERRAVDADRSKAEFVAHMSHELRTPLNAIIGFSEVIEQGLFGAAGHPKYVEYAHDIGAAGRHLHAKIGDILDFANLEAGRQPIDLAIVDASAVSRDVIAEFAGKAFSRRIRLVVALPERAAVVADALGLKRVLANLVENAVRFTPEGGTIRLQIRSESDCTVLALRDSGFGFAPGEAERAGEAFATFGRPGAVTGSGLGLAIAMALARRMGGSIRLGGSPGEGALAELRLRKAAD